MQKKSRILDIWATWIIALSIVALIFCFVGYFGYVLCAKPIASEPIVIHIIQDSTCNEVLYNRSQLDSVLHLMQKQNLDLNEKFQRVLEKKTDEDVSRNFFVVIASVLISICSFFGYKSIKDMKEGIKNSVEGLSSNIAREKSQEIASQKATKVAEQVASTVSKTVSTHVSTKQSTIVAQKETERYLQNNVKKIVLEQADSVYKETITTSLREEVLKGIDGTIDARIEKIFGTKEPKRKRPSSNNSIKKKVNSATTSSEPIF